MPLNIIDYNSSSANYEFNISAITNQEWVDLALEIIYEKTGTIRNVCVVGYLVKIGDNVARIQLEYQDSKFHVVNFRLNEFGLIDGNYTDEFSKRFQEVMQQHYGEKYNQKLNEQLTTKSL